MIKLEKLTKKFGKRCIFHDFSIELPSNGIVVIVGESGSGKSTLLNIIAGLDFDYTGRAVINKTDLSKLRNDELNNFRLKNIGYVFQNFNLMNLDTVMNNVLFPIEVLSNASMRIKKQRTLDCLKLVGIENLKKQRINKLSGGEKQRTAIARAIINDPSVILCDEPTGALDEKTGVEIFKLLRKISSSKLVIIATHDVETIKQYAKIILEIKNEEITVKNLVNIEENEEILLIGPGNLKEKTQIPFGFKVRHSIQKIKAKKYRSLITNIMLSLSLTGVGLSLIVSSSLSDKVNSAFKSILNGNQIVVSLKNENENSFSNSYTADYEKVHEIYIKYKYHFDGIGVNYMVNFENFFKDRNEFFISSSAKKISIPSLSARSINEYKWLENDFDKVAYPFDVEILDDDQIVLGLSELDMINICYQLQIQRNFTSLGHYIYEKGLFLTFAVRNDFWQYDDEQIFNVVGVCLSNNSCIYHTNPLWNEYIFEEMMRIPSDDDENHDFPWEMYKSYYFKTKNDPAQFLDAALYDRELDDYVFERTNYLYNPILCKYGFACEEHRIFVYLSDKYFVSPSIVNIFKNNIKNLDNYYFNSDFGYASYASNIFAGFSKNVFIGADQHSVDEAIDADTQLNSEINIEINLPDHVVQGNFLNSLGNGLRFSTKFNNLIYGREPTNLNEIVISKGLAEKLDKNTLCMGKYLSFAGEIEEYLDAEGNCHKEYNSTQILVVGIVDEEKNYIYHKPNWSISFFRDKLGVSSFNLIPKSIVFEFDDESSAVDAYNTFISLTNEYKFTNPLEDLKSNVDSTLDYANTILIAFSILATVISVLLLGTVLMLNIIESKDEVKLFKHLGITGKQINSIFVFQGVAQGFIAFIVSSFELLVVDFVISYLIGDYLNTGFQFSFNSIPILVIFIMAIFVPIIISRVMLLFIGRAKKESS